MADRTCSIEGCDSRHEARGWCNKHYHRWRRTGDPLKTLPGRWQSTEERFWAKVDKDGPLPKWAPFLGPCWVWTTGTTGRRGRGRFYLDGQDLFAHRAAYILLVGPIPDGLELDHLCRVPTCVNPAHLEPVTHQVNMSRGRFGITSHCPQGHPYSGDNLRIQPDGSRRCFACTQERWRRTIPTHRSCKRCGEEFALNLNTRRLYCSETCVVAGRKERKEARRAAA